jgi:hypothetical protein
MTKDALQTPDDMADEDEGKTKDDEKMLCNLKDDYVNRTLSSISSPRPSSNESACSSDTIHCDEVNSICSMEDTVELFWKFPKTCICRIPFFLVC